MDLEKFKNDFDYAESCQSQDDFIKFIHHLESDFKTNKNNWANCSIDSFLSAVASSCESSPGWRVGDPFEKDEEYVKDRCEFIKMTHRTTGTIGSDKYHEDMANLPKKDSPWKILAHIFLSGKYYE